MWCNSRGHRYRLRVKIVSVCMQLPLQRCPHGTHVLEIMRLRFLVRVQWHQESTLAPSQCPNSNQPCLWRQWTMLFMVRIIETNTLAPYHFFYLLEKVPFFWIVDTTICRHIISYQYVDISYQLLQHKEFNHQIVNVVLSWQLIERNGESMCNTPLFGPRADRIAML